MLVISHYTVPRSPFYGQTRRILIFVVVCITVPSGLVAFRLLGNLVKKGKRRWENIQQYRQVRPGDIADLEWCVECNRRSQMKSKTPVYGGSLFCSPGCIATAERRGPFIIQIPYLHRQYTVVSDLFIKSWRHPTEIPRVLHVYAIVGSHVVMKPYRLYMDSFRSWFKRLMGRSANEQQLWHGTKRACRLGDNGNATLCYNKSCSLCQIIKNSFDVGRFRSHTPWGRFGAGIYTSSATSKCNDYSRDSFLSKTKALLLNNVVIGRGMKLRENAPHLTATLLSDYGYDSVLGEVGGSALNYEEQVVFVNEAIRPSYLVIYAWDL